MASWRAGVAVGCAAILVALYLPLWFNRYKWGRFKYHLSTSETKAVDWQFPSWPIFFILLSAMLLRKDSHIDPSGKGTISLLLLIGLGVVGGTFIIFSQTGEFGEFGDIDVTHLVLGLVLAVGAMALGNLKAFGIDWGRNLGNQLSSSLRGLGNDPAIFFVIISSA